MKKDYETYLKELFSINVKKGMSLGLARMKEALKRLGNPESRYDIVHVAGTNGKGSVCLKVAKGFESQGKKVGLYTSPHIASYRERIRINGQMISKEDLVEILPTIFNAAPNSTFFEITTLLALYYFALKKVDAAVLETGLGGRLDATNVVNPVLTIVTSISFDHMAQLGNSLEAIAKEKAGIIKEGIPLVVGPSLPWEIFASEAQNQKAPFYRVKGQFSTFNEENNATAKKAMEVLKFPKEAIEKGLLSIPACRAQKVHSPSLKHPIFLDVGHNPAGLTSLFQTIRKEFPKAKLIAVMGLGKEKDQQECLRIVKAQASSVHFVTAANGRGEDGKNLRDQIINLGLSQAHAYPCIKEGLNAALNEAQKEESLLLITGTFFIMSEARALLGLVDEIDFQDMNERTV